MFIICGQGQETLLSMVEKKLTDRLPAGGASVSASGGSSAKVITCNLFSCMRKQMSVIKTTV